MPGLPPNPTLTDGIKAAIKAALALIETSLPGRIISYDHSAQRASVVPVIQGAFIDAADERTFVDLPEIHNCPVVFFAAGHASLTSKLSVGDRVTLLFCSRDIAGWLTNDSNRNPPSDPRRHAMDDVMVVPGVRSFANPLGADAVSATDAVLAAEAIQLGSSAATDFIALASLVAAMVSSHITGTYNTHTHPVVGANTGLPTPLGTSISADSIRSQKVRSE